MRLPRDVGRGLQGLHLQLPLPARAEDATGPSLEDELASYTGPLSRDEARLLLAARHLAEARKGASTARPAHVPGARLQAHGPREAREAQARTNAERFHALREEKKRKGQLRRVQRKADLEAEAGAKRIAPDATVLKLWELVQPLSYVTPYDLAYVRDLAAGKTAREELLELRRWMRARTGEWLSYAACAIWAVHWALLGCGNPDDKAAGHPGVGFQVPNREWAEEVLGVPRRTLMEANARLSELGLITRYGHELDVSTLTGGEWDAVVVSFGPKQGTFPVERCTTYSTAYMTAAGARVAQGYRLSTLPRFLQRVHALLEPVREAVKARFVAGAPHTPAPGSPKPLPLFPARGGRREAQKEKIRTPSGLTPEYRKKIISSSTSETFRTGEMAERPEAAAVHSERLETSPSQAALTLSEALVQTALRRGWGSSATALASFVDWCTRREVWMDRDSWVRAYRRLEGCTCGQGARLTGLHWRDTCRARYRVVQGHERRGARASKRAVRAPVLSAADAWEVTWAEHPALRGHLTRLFEPIRIEVLRRLALERIAHERAFTERAADSVAYKAMLAREFAARVQDERYARTAADYTAEAAGLAAQLQQLTSLETQLREAQEEQYAALHAELRGEACAAERLLAAETRVAAIAARLDARGKESAGGDEGNRGRGVD